MSSGRMHLQNEIHLVTNRCFQERLFMLPNDEVNFIIGYWFARALELYGAGLEIFAFVFLSNHFHFLLRDTTGTLSTFMGYFQANVARAINRRLGRKGTFWQGHYDDKIVDGKNTFWEKYTYVTCNAVKAGLVDTAAEWIGWSSLDKSLQGGEFSFTAINRHRYNKACQNRKKKPDAKQFEETYAFSLTPPLGQEEKSIAEQAAHIRPLLSDQETKSRVLRGEKLPLGIEFIRTQNPTDRPRNPSRSPKKRFACKDKARLKERLAEYRDFIGSFRAAFDQMQKATRERKRFHSEWPVGSYPPGERHPVVIES